MLLGPGTFGGFMLVPRRNNWTSCVYMRVSPAMHNPVTCIDTHLLLGGHDSQILVRHPEVLLELRKAGRWNPVQLRREHLRRHRHPPHARHAGYLTVCQRWALLYGWRCRIAGRSTDQWLILLLRCLLSAGWAVGWNGSYLSQRRVLSDACHRVMRLGSTRGVRRRVSHSW